MSSNRQFFKKLDRLCRKNDEEFLEDIIHIVQVFKYYNIHHSTEKSVEYTCDDLSVQNTTYNYVDDIITIGLVLAGVDRETVYKYYSNE